MQFFLISDNADTAMGMRLAGINGVIVHERSDVLDLLENVVNDGKIAIVLVTPVIAKMCEDIITDFKLNRRLPLICEIPDRHVNTNVTASISKCVKEAIGISIED